MTAALLALVALVPAMVGPPPHAKSVAVLTARLCSGGTMTIPLPGKSDGVPAPCRQKGCHAGCRRKRIDPAQ